MRTRWGIRSDTQIQVGIGTALTGTIRQKLKQPGKAYLFGLCICDMPYLSTASGTIKWQIRQGQIQITSCGPTSAAMLVDYWRSELGLSSLGAQFVVKHALNNHLYLPDDQEQIYTRPANMVSIVQDLLDTDIMSERLMVVSGQTSSTPSAAKAVLLDLLSQGYPVIVDVTVSTLQGEANNAHFVVVTGMDSAGKVYFHDPYSRGDFNEDGIIEWDETGGAKRAVSWENFYWAWTHNSDADVGGIGWWMTLQPADWR